MTAAAIAIAAAIAESQHGVVSRAQLVAAGLTRAQARQPVESGRWQVVLPGVYATFTGPVTETARIWAAVLYAGRDALASHWTALWLADRSRPVPTRIHVTVPGDRRVRAPWPVRIHHARGPADRGPGAPPRTSVTRTVLDVTDTLTRLDGVLGLVFQVTQRRTVDAAALVTALSRRRRHRWRSALLDVLAEVQDGVTSPLERHYVRRVELPHGLPRGRRNRPERAPDGATVFRDVRYDGFGVVVELDGREAHPDDRRFRDMRRDNRVVVQAEAVLRFGWHDILGASCHAAAQVATVLAARGWRQSPRRCGPRCALWTS